MSWLSRLFDRGPGARSSSRVGDTAERIEPPIAGGDQGAGGGVIHRWRAKVIHRLTQNYADF